MIEFRCSNCSHNIRARDEYVGKRVRCPKCKGATRVPVAQGESGQEQKEIIKFRCSNCNQKMGLPAKYAGKQVRCAKCREAIRVPAVSERSGQDKAEKIKFSCEHCGQRYGVPRKHGGKRVKCKKCGQAIVVPKAALKPAQEVPAAVEAAAGGMAEQDQWASDLLAMEAAAPEAKDVLKVAALEPEALPSQGQALADKAAWSGDYGTTSGSAERKGGVGLGIGGLPLAIAASFGGAVLGAIIWAVIACVTGYEIGFIAWGVGALAGAGMSLLSDRQSVGLGLLAAFFAFVGILMGKMFVANWVVLPMLEKEVRNYKPTDDQIAWVLEDPNMLFCVACLTLADEGEFDEELAWKTIAVQMSGEVPAEDGELIQSAREKSLRVVDSWSESEKKAAAEAQAGKLVSKFTDFIMASKIGLLLAFIATFSFFDLLWFPMALVSAFKIGSGRD